MRRILVVDESVKLQPPIRKMLRRIPESRISFVTDAQTALAGRMSTDRFDLVISSLEMLDMDGFQLLKSILDLHQHTPVILMAESGNEQTAMAALKLGAAGYVCKRRLRKELVAIALQIIDSEETDSKRGRLLEYMATTNSEFVIDNDPSLIPALLGRLQASLKLFDICDEGERLRVRMALEEAISNSLYHGNLEIGRQSKELDESELHELTEQRRGETPYCDRVLTIQERFSREEAVFTVRDQGTGFDFSAIPDPTDPQVLAQPSVPGIAKMYAFMDEVIYNVAGNEVTLVKQKKLPTYIEDGDSVNDIIGLLC